jgi:peptide/nickel transport system substrate-binding protein
MDTFKNVLLVLIAILLVVQIIDRSREPSQMGELAKALDLSRSEFQKLRKVQEDLVARQDAIEASSRELAVSLDAFRKGFDQGFTLGGGNPGQPRVTPTAPTETDDPGQVVSVVDVNRDGVPRLDENFLLPLDFSGYEADKIGGTYKRFAGEPTGLNDLLSSMRATSDVVNMVNSSLATTTAMHPDKWTEGLAESVIISDDYRTFTFTLRDDIFWSIPNLASEAGFEWLDKKVPVTAHDFVFRIELIQNPIVQAPHLRPYYEELEEAVALDDRTLVLRWKERLYTNITFSLGLEPQPRHVYGFYEDGAPIPDEEIPVSFNKHWFDAKFQVIGPGAYILESFVPKEAIVFRRNPEYRGVPEHFERQYWDLSVQAPDAQLTAFKNGQVHSFGLRPAQYKAEILDQLDERFAPDSEENPKAGREGAFGWERYGANSWSGVCWNTKRRVVSEIPVRRALAHAYPFERIISQILFGLGQRSIGPVHPSSPYANVDTQPFEYDLEKAKAILDEAGWTDSDGDGWRDKMIDGTRTPLKIRITYYGQARTWANILSLYSEECRKIGIDLAGDPVEDQEWARRADDRDFDGFVVVWRSGLDVDFKQLWHSSTANEPKSSNYAGWSSDEADPLIDALRDEFDLEKRYDIAATVANIIYQEQPYLFLSVSKGVFAWQNLPANEGDDRELLDGVTWGFDNYHPLFNRSNARWFVREP